MPPPCPSRTTRTRPRVAAIPILSAVVALALAAAAGGCGLVPPPPGPPPDTVAGQATVARVIDGDTLVAHLDGEDETVRLIGIDTPETKRPGTPVECFGPESAAHLAGLLPEGSAVRLERDATERDRYGRLLAYVHRVPDETFVNLAMVAGGFAASYRVPPNVARTAELAAGADEARRQGRGLWGRCGGAHEPAPP